MTITSVNIWLVLVGLLSGLLIEWLILSVVRRPGWLAEVNERSSHAAPTPTMGGLMIVLVVSAYLIYLWSLDIEMGAALLTGGVAMAAVGLWDDLSPLSARIRLPVHMLAAAGVLSVLGFDSFSVVWCLALLGFVWFVNLFNFMDGIDGIATAQALVFCLGVQWLVGPVPGWSGELLWVTISASVAFLAFNWPPAKIFMGDVGSGFLGFLIAAMVMHLWMTDVLPLITSMILLAGFWFDATYTLCVRILTQQRFTQAHRSHLYQRLADRKGHQWTTSAYLLFVCVWLVPLAWLSLHEPAWAIWVLIAAVAPLMMLCIRFRAGIGTVAWTPTS